MGTFHDNLGDLHGITVAVHLKDGSVAVGRCHESTDTFILILDADHHQAPEGQSVDAWLANAVKWGVFPKHKVLQIDMKQVQSVTPLSQVVV